MLAPALGIPALQASILCAKQETAGAWNRVSGRWRHAGERRHRPTHRGGGHVDEATVPFDGNSLDGVNHSGHALHGTRCGV